MTESTIIINISAFAMGTFGCYIAHGAGIRYAYFKQRGLSSKSVIIKIIESITFILLAIVVVQLK
jgi:hypothetical protein